MNAPILAAIAEGQEPALAAALSRRSAQTVRAGGWAWLDESRTSDLYRVQDGVAIVTIRGVLLDSLEFHGSEWATGYNCIRIAVEAAIADQSVAALVLDIDSPGGMVSGCFELCEWLLAAGGAKPIYAFVAAQATSAAYAIACCAGEITCPRTGAVGSVGVVQMHVDWSVALEKAGIRISLVHAGKHKIDGHPFAALPDEVRADMQATLEAIRRIFADHVAAGRGVTPEAVLATEARTYCGPIGIKSAVDLGLIDAIASPDAAMDALISTLPRP